MKEQCIDLPFLEQLHCMSRTEILHIMSDCSGHDEVDIIHVIEELGRRYEKNKPTCRESDLFTLLACSTDPKQYNFGLFMLREYHSAEEREKHLVAVYQYAGKPEWLEKSVPRITAGAYLNMNKAPGEDIETYINQLFIKHSDYLEKIGTYRDQRMISSYS